MPQILSQPHWHQLPLVAHHHQLPLTVTHSVQKCPVTIKSFPASTWVRPAICPAKLLPSIRCMANPRRVKMVAKQIMRELSQMLITDTVLQYAVQPEAALGADRYMSSVTTISDVEVSSDLQVAKVYVSVFGDERGKDLALSGLKSKAKYVRGELGRRMKLRLTPEIRFIEDESIERGSRVIAILDRLKEEKTRGSKRQGDSSGLTKDNKDWEDDDDDDPDDDDDDDRDDEGIIYVD